MKTMHPPMLEIPNPCLTTLTFPRLRLRQDIPAPPSDLFETNPGRCPLTYRFRLAASPCAPLAPEVLVDPNSHALTNQLCVWSKYDSFLMLLTLTRRPSLEKLTLPPICRLAWSWILPSDRYIW